MSSPQHVLRVQRVYRQYLKQGANWHFLSHQFKYFADQVRKGFERNRNASPGRAQELLAQAEEETARAKHWSPYRHPDMFGANRFQRYPKQPFQQAPSDW